jgi:hypothetical protein
MILNLDLPGDPIRQLMYLSGVREAVEKDLNAAFQSAYFEARMMNLMPQALALHQHARKRALAFTRAENERRGRVVKKWGDEY